MSFSDRVEELNQEIGASVERAVSDLRRRLAERLRASNEQMLREVEELAPSLPASFLADVHVAPFADEASASARQTAFSELRDGLVAIDRSRSQTEVLTALLGATGSFASRSAILLLRGGDVRGWGAHGFNDEANVRAVAFAVPAAGAAGDAGGWGRLAAGEGAVRLTASECAELCSQLESPLAHDGVAVPIVLRDQLAAVLYADSTGGSDASDASEGQGNHALNSLNPLNIEALQTLTYVAAQAIELLPLRERASTATLHLAEPAEAGDAAATAGTHEDEAAGEASHAPEASPAEPAASEPHQEAQPETAPEPQAAAEPEPEHPASQAGSVAETSEVHWPVQEDHGADELVELPEEEETYWGGKTETWAAPVPEPEPSAPLAPAAPTEPAEPATHAEPAELISPVAEAPQETVLLQRPSFEPPAAPTPEPTYPRPVAPLAAAAPAAAGFEAPSLPAPAAAPPDAERSGTPATPANTNPEVRPPSDVEGPGWAFATTRVQVSPDDAELHESARRLARLLVSEIKLYNEDQVEEGRRNRDVYERLKEDIDRSRQMYEERVEPRVWKSTDYFYQELVRILAAGDSRALGI